MYGKKYSITVLEDNGDTQNPIGEEVENWETKGTVNGRIWTLGGSEQYQSAKDTRIIRNRMACDSPSFTITEDNEISYNGVTYDIEVVNDIDKQGKRLEIDLKEVD